MYYRRTIGAKPIEAGCWAMQVGGEDYPEQNGRIFHVIRYLGHILYDGHIYKDVWDVEEKNGGMIEKILMRIDDPEIQKQIESEREKVKVSCL